MAEPVRLLSIVAHPDDSEGKAAGLSKRIIDNGGTVRWVSVTDGSQGHQHQAGALLANRRAEENRRAAELVGAERKFLDNTDGALQPDLATRTQIIREIREFNPDVIVGPRIYDYHPDHRYTAQLIQDATYMIQVPNVVPNVPPMDKAPVVLYLNDHFTRPVPLRPDLVFDVSDLNDLKTRVFAQHESQVYEWLPAHYEDLGEPPADRQKGGLDYVRRGYIERPLADANNYREGLIARYGQERAAAATLVEVFEVSEYGHPLTPELADWLFPF